MKAIRIEDDEHMRLFGGAAGDRLQSLGEIESHGADEHWVVVDRHGSAVARSSLWWTSPPPLPGDRVGVIGHYAARSEEAAATVLEMACDRLSGEGCTVAVGPMDGNTWRKYRLIIEKGDEPPFFLDLQHPDTWPGHFTDNGFTPMANYVSTLNADLSRRDPRESEWSDQMSTLGVTIRPIDPARFEEELRYIFAMSLESFRRNLLYQPIDEPEFVRMYRPLSTVVQPELVRIAQRGRDPVGFAFCLPDLLQADGGGRIDTVILKTLAVHPDFGGKRLGTCLSAEVQRVAHECGYGRLIYAFMQEDNPSVGISAHYAKPIRRYALFARRLVTS